MMEKKLIIEKLYGFQPDDIMMEKLEIFQKEFIEYNKNVNLMGKNDIPYFFEKHVLDSLSLFLTNLLNKNSTMLDVGAGGGFPSVVISIFFPDIKVFAMDSISKKIKFIEKIKSDLDLNLVPILSRAEDYPPLNVDILTSRAVGEISKVWKNSKSHLKNGGFFVSYKAKTAHKEALEAKRAYRELREEKIIPYKLPIEGELTRNLVIFNFCNNY